MRRSTRRRSSSPAFDELEHASPRVVGRVGELLLLAVEEAVRRALVGDELVLDAGLLQRGVERGDVLGANRLIRTAHQPEDRRLELAGALSRARRAVRALAWSPVEADRAGQAVPARCGQPRMAPAEAEADREHGAA